MFFFVSEPVADPMGGATFVVGVITVRCASMTEAISLSHRLRAALQALASRGGRPRLRPESVLPSIAIGEWIEELVAHGLALDELSSQSSVHCRTFEVPK